MDKNALDRLRQLAGNAPREQYTAADSSRQNMYQIRDSLMESSAVDRARYDAASDDKKKVTLKKAPWEKDKKEVKEGEKPDFADLDKDGDKKEPMAKAAKEKDLDESKYPWLDHPDRPGAKKDKDAEDKDDKDEKKVKTEADMMREWSNSVYQQYDDAGSVQEQPEGETVDLSLRRYLNAQPQHVTTVAEDIQPDDLLREYKEFKKKPSKK